MFVLRSVIRRSFQASGLSRRSKVHTRYPIYAVRRCFATEANTLTTGQPIHETRPHLVEAGNITPGISAQEYYTRRLQLAQQLPSGSAAIILGASVKFASGSVFYYFRQNDDLYYLSGWNEPDSVLILEKVSDDLENGVIFHMLVPPKDSRAEQWEGHRTGVEGVKEIFNADESAENDKVESYVKKIISRNKFIYTDIEPRTPQNNKGGAELSNFFSSSNYSSKFANTFHEILKQDGKSVRPLKPLIRDMRIIKSPAELQCMRTAGKISGRVYNMAYERSNPEHPEHIKTEHQLAAFLDYQFRIGGCQREAYIPVVAGGPNALCIHYVRNDDVLRPDEMVLVDAAGNYGGYCADISRTWPNNGKFSPAQKDLYQAVLNVEKECIKLCTVEAAVTLHDIHQTSEKLMFRELKNCGFNDINAWDVPRFLYPHYIGHNLGLDVHDVQGYSRTNNLKEGQVVTIEPGVYVPNNSRWPKSYRGIGIRIEDDISVGKDTYTNLTVEAAKEVVDIEHIAAHGVTTPYKSLSE